MPFKGQLKQGLAFTFQITSDAGNSDGTAVTLLKINRKDHISDANPITVARGASVPITDTAGTSIDRLLLILNPSQTAANAPGQVTVQTSQNGVIISTDTYTGDIEVAYDTVP